MTPENMSDALDDRRDDDDAHPGGDCIMCGGMLDLDEGISSNYCMECAETDEGPVLPFHETWKALDELQVADLCFMYEAWDTGDRRVPDYVTKAEQKLRDAFSLEGSHDPKKIASMDPMELRQLVEGLLTEENPT